MLNINCFQQNIPSHSSGKLQLDELDQMRMIQQQGMNGQANGRMCHSLSLPHNQLSSTNIPGAITAAGARIRGTSGQSRPNLVNDHINLYAMQISRNGPNGNSNMLISQEMNYPLAHTLQSPPISRSMNLSYSTPLSTSISIIGKSATSSRHYSREDTILNDHRIATAHNLPYQDLICYIYMSCNNANQQISANFIA